MASIIQPSEASTPKELELIEKLNKLEADRVKFLSIVQGKVKQLEQDIETKNRENERLVQRNKELETSLKEMLSIGGKSKNGNKALDDDVLLRAKELLFEKTKICKKLELQMEALNNQVVATKDALDITKSMLNLKNVENDHLESRLEAMQSRVKCERDRANLIEKKLNVSQQKGDALTKEYDLQRNIFKDLRSTYEEKINILNNQVATLKQET